MYIYILRCEDRSLYTGITTNLVRRIRQHTGKIKGGAKYTVSHKVIFIEAVWFTDDKQTARKLEYRIKKLSKASKERLISSPLLIYEMISDISENPKELIKPFYEYEKNVDNIQ
ncbi:MAG: GIY-YIG nuclease family protein [Ruminococcus sp.]|nr:GIY-YIG nuclease family protein [Ruminococcus sp.]MBP1566033.1 GIY-YIG nuclease family protein [Oscillospiraceae bacterium]